MAFYDTLVIVSLILWIIVSLGLILAFVTVVPRILRSLRQMEQLSGDFLKKAMPVLDQSEQVLDQVSLVTTSLADDVDRIDRAVIRATSSLEGMVELAEDRVSEINALVEVAVEEAEETFFSTAALMRVLRVGSRGRKRRRSRAERRRLG